MEHHYNKKKFALVLDKLLTGTMEGTIKWKRLGKQYHWSYPPKNGWEWHVAKGSIHIGIVSNNVYLSIFNENDVEIINNLYNIDDIENPVVEIYHHVQEEYDKMGAEIIEKLLQDLNNL